MKVYELIITVLLKKDLYYQAVQEEIGIFLNRSMLKNDNLKKFHRETRLKGYVYSGLYPVEKTKIYSKGNVYVFRLRSLDENFIRTMEICIRGQRDNVFQVISGEKRLWTKGVIQELHSITPFFITVDDSPWLQEDDFDLLIKRLQINAEKKYRDFIQEDIETNQFVQRIELLNYKPMAVRYKGIKLLGHKAKIIVNNDDDAQRLAYTVLGSGLGEKNSAVGGGFCYAKFL